jgi:hypothetical protein
MDTREVDQKRKDKPTRDSPYAKQASKKIIRGQGYQQKLVEDSQGCSRNQADNCGNKDISVFCKGKESLLVATSFNNVEIVGVGDTCN